MLAVYLGMRIIVVGFSGGVTSAWCAGWAKRNYPHEEIRLLFTDTQEEDKDTYRFLHEMAAALGMPITERSDGRDIAELARDEGAVPNDRMPFCSRILKQEPANKYIVELQEQGATEIVRVMGFSANEPDRIQRHVALCWQQSSFFCDVSVRFPLVEEKVTKQECWDWCNCTMGVAPSAMYEWSEHANCPGCFRGKKRYWQAVGIHRPDIYQRRSNLEKEMGFTILNNLSLEELAKEPVKPQRMKESIEIGPCECGS
jgi:hypothetical protein